MQFAISGPLDLVSEVLRGAWHQEPRVAPMQNQRRSLHRCEKWAHIDVLNHLKHCRGSVGCRGETLISAPPGSNPRAHRRLMDL